MAQSANVTWQDSIMSRSSRWGALDAHGATVWLTGLPAAGKSTLGAALEERLVLSGRFAYLLDGDNLRHGICGDLGFDEADRARNILRVGELARLFADAGAIAIVALVSPLAGVRDEVRARHATAGLRFVEVFLDTPLAECAARDPKNLYARARAGELADLTGVGQAYEAPAQPEVTVEPGTALACAVDAVLESLDATSHQRNGVKR
ncbi:MAG TPA: adenylyl-sulfate kinase [Solirubrobacteraceae bacterium]|nr:adenylyl-sulfate kinase [Solirubrobacteraceae bacterium]